MENLKNYCEVLDLTFKDEETGEDVAYRRVVWHVGNTVIELVPTKKSKQALQVLIDLGIIDVKES